MEWMWKTRKVVSGCHPERSRRVKNISMQLCHPERSRRVFYNKELVFFLFIFFTITAFAQDSTTVISENANSVELKKFDEKRWENLTKNLDYTETLKKKKDHSFSLPNMNFDPTIIKIVVVSLVVLSLIFLLWKIFGNTAFLSNRKIKEGDFSFLDEAEENLESSDLERFLKDALDKKHYKVAVRIYYLMSIKELMLQNFIVWKKNKTNFEYLGEMRERSEFEHFRSLTRAFEIVWYGDVEIGEHEYSVLSPSFKTFITSIRNNGQK